MITLKTLATATEQEIFDQVVSHLLTQNRQSKVKGKCLYRLRLPDNVVLKCAAGCLIADDEYNEDMEYKTWDTLHFYLRKELNIPENHNDIINQLQNIHDCYLPDLWNFLLRELAIKRSLEFNFKKDDIT